MSHTRERDASADVLDPRFVELCRLYARHTPAVSLGSDDPAAATAALEAAARAHRRLARRRTVGEPIVDVRAAAPGHPSVLDVISDDLPFLVESVLAGVGRAGQRVRRVIHAMVVVRRGSGGELVEALPAVAPEDAPPDALVEEWMRLDLDPISTDENEDLEAELSEVLRAVREVAEDREEIAATVQHVAAELLERPGSPGDERPDAARLLQWLHDGRFLFLGYRRHEVDRRTGLRAVPGSGLGVLRRADVPDGVPGELAVDAGARPPVVLTRSGAPSRVLRPEHPHHLSIVILDAGGGVVGEHRFVGLFTAAALHENVLDTPVVERRVRAAVRLAGVPLESWSGQRMLDVISRHPRDELFWATPDDLHDTAVGVLGLTQPRRLRLFARREPYGRYFSCLVYLPHDRYSPHARSAMQKVLLGELGGWRIDHSVELGEPGLALVHFTVQVDPASPAPDRDRLQAQLAAANLSWDDWVLDAAGNGDDEIVDYLAGVPQGYRDSVDPVRALADLRRIRELGDEPHLELSSEPRGDEVHFRLFLLGAGVSLSAVLPALQSLGVEVLDERPFEIIRPDGSTCFLYDFALAVDVVTARSLAGPGRRDTQERFCAAFRGMWRGDAEADRFNAMVLRAGLGWRDVAVLRAYARYAAQLGGPFGPEYVAEILLAHPPASRALIDLFHARFDPEPSPQERAQRSAAAMAAVTALIDEVTGLDADRILRGLLALVDATVRTNWFTGRRHISFKIDPTAVPDMPAPRPRFEIFVYSPQVEGVHLRFGRVARGGLRWSDRPHDYRTEVLGLVKAQAVKNAVIVPVGAKGGFVVRAPAPGPDEVQDCYRTFVAGLLDITDNVVTGPDGALTTVPPSGVVRHDGDDSYLVVAADKGTARFSDLANAVAAEHRFWLGDAFASGGSVGYDHKAMGITARGAWESVKRHFAELGTDPEAEDVTVVGVGDMSGDVFGNGMLLSEHIRLVAAFDHRHVFVDPNPDPARSHVERRRLFDLPRSSWDDYDRGLISPGGGVWLRTAKAVPVGSQMRAALGLADEVSVLSPPELIRAILLAPVDLLWNGGIGTYVKAEGESHAEVGDKANDAIRVDGARLRVKVVGEGGNLGATQRGRIEFAGGGGRINTDAIDNSAGVDCSDHEVNIKIMLDRLVAAGELDRAGRNALLAEMTDEVARLVLADNRAQNAELGLARMSAPARLPVHARMIDDLERRRGLDRALEVAPGPEEIAERERAGEGLTSPELAVLLAHTKLDLKAEILRSGVPDLPEFACCVADAFPAVLVERFPTAVAAHPLRREIVATALVNEMVAGGGITYGFRLTEDSGATPADAMRAFRVATAVFDLTDLWNDVAALPASVPTAPADEVVLESRRLLDGAARWLLTNRPQPLSVPAEIDRFAPQVRRLMPGLPSLLRGRETKALGERAAELAERGVPSGLAARAAVLVHGSGLLDVIEVAALDERKRQRLPIEDVAGLYYALSSRVATADRRR
ncbi:NAD-glutamate dehydrogenase [Pseudonocardia nigra]|uniref:NAD-glutamate dehydrogenase n=1 Tax=Pseudonocardia nigra TaxID=1921578 RepID=UPI001C5CDC03|nr:NAD-glutamate dehydrogenase [Pseudonocardia nigra]